MNGRALPLDDRSEAGKVLDAAAPHVSTAQAAEISRVHFGIEGVAQPMASERDHNFRLTAAGGKSYVLKISHPDEPVEVVDFQVRALEHIARADPGLPAPAVVPTSAGAATVAAALDGTSPRLCRMLTFMRGKLLQDAAPSPVLDRNLGSFLARLGKAMRGFFHPAAGTDLLWDIRRIGTVRSMTGDTMHASKRRAVELAADEYLTVVEPILSRFRAQVVHNDMSRSNVVVDPGTGERVTGIIDFGDMMHAPLVCDIAVGASYRWTPDEHPLAGAARFVAGYKSVLALEDEEVSVLFTLIKARLALVCAIVEWQVRRFPEKREYVSRWNSEITQSLLRLTEVSRSEAADILLRAS
jgi:Ser/Thr protein kinase RdoA (MazF antagonist)